MELIELEIKRKLELKHHCCMLGQLIEKLSLHATIKKISYNPNSV